MIVIFQRANIVSNTALWWCISIIAWHTWVVSLLVYCFACHLFTPNIFDIIFILNLLRRACMFVVQTRL